MHLVGLYTYCKMMHGAYNVKLIIKFISYAFVLNFNCSFVYGTVRLYDFSESD